MYGTLPQSSLSEMGFCIRFSLIEELRKEVGKDKFSFEHEEIEAEIGTRAQKFVKEHFDWKEIVKLHDGIYAKLLKRIRKKNE